MKKKWEFLCRFKSGFVVLLTVGISYPIQAYAYEPVIKQSSVTSSRFSGDPTKSTIYTIDASKFDEIDMGHDSLSFNWQFYLDSTDCTGAGIGKAFGLFKATMPKQKLASFDKLRIISYLLSFIPRQGALQLTVQFAPDVGGYSGNPVTTSYDLYLLDRFDDAYNPGYTFCEVTSPSKLDVTLYVNAYNSYIAIRTPENPLGKVLTTPVRVGFGVSMMQLAHDKDHELVFANYVRTTSAAVPPNALKVYVKYNQFYWNRVKNAPAGSDSYRNLADDINVFYGAKNYPLRSPVLDRTNAAAAMTVFF